MSTLPESNSLQRLGEPTVRFSSEVIASYQKPCVYIWSRNGEPLYLGASVRGVVRPLGKHERIRIEPGDEVTVWTVDDPKQLPEIERALILELKPRYNRAHLETPEYVLRACRRRECSATFRIYSRATRAYCSNYCRDLCWNVK